MKLLRHTVVAFLLILISFVVAPAQSSPPSSPQGQPQAKPGDAHASQPTAVLRVTTRLVILDVVALDHKGVPVTDLKQEDFSLQEEGTEQKVRVFSLQQPATTTEAQLTAVKIAPNVISNQPSYQPNKTLSVILLDALNTDITNQKYVRQEMLKFLDKLPSGQPVAIYALTRKLRLLQDFTTDVSLLKQAVSASKKSTAVVGGPDAPYLNAATTSAMTEMGLSAMVTQIQLFERDDVAMQADGRIETTINALKSLARTLAGYPGRKNLIWMSSGFPALIFPPSDSIARAGETKGLNVIRNYSDDIEILSNALSNARVAVYPVDAGSLMNASVNSSLSNTDSVGNYLGRTATGRGSSRTMAEELNVTPDALLATHSTMNSVADGTGGKAFYNTNNLEGAIREGMSDGTTYYTLGYYPENKNWDGKFRRLTLKVNRPGIKLRYRQGYLAADPTGYSKIEPRKQALDLGLALSFDYPVATALLFRAEVAPPSAETGNKTLIRYGIDPHAMSFELKGEDLQHASVDCAVQAYTTKGEALQPHASTFSANLRPEQYQAVMKQFFPCSQSLDLPPGDYVLRLGVRDNGTGLIGTANARVTVPASLPSPAASTEKKP